MIRLINDKKLEGFVPSSLSSYNIEKDYIRDLFEVASKRFNDYMRYICYYSEKHARIADTPITKYTMEEYLLAYENKWDLDGRGTILNSGIRIFEMDKSDIELIPYAKKGFSIFVPKDWMMSDTKSLWLLVKIADHSIMEMIPDKITIGAWDNIWVHKFYELNFPVLIFCVEYYITLFKCIISSSSKITYKTFIYDAPDDYNSPFNETQEKSIWHYAEKLVNNVELESDYANMMKSVFDHRSIYT